MNLLMWSYFYHIHTTAVWFNFSTAPVEAGTRKNMLCPVLDWFLPTLAWTIKINGKSHSRWSIPHDIWQHVVLDNWTKFVSSSNAWNTKLGGAPTAPNVAPPAGSPLWRSGSVTLRWWSGAGLPNEHWQGAGHRFWQCPKSAKWADSLVTEGTSLLEVPKRHDDSRSKWMILCIFSWIVRSFVPMVGPRHEPISHFQHLIHLFAPDISSERCTLVVRR